MEGAMSELRLQRPREGWLRHAVLSGFAATLVMSFVFIAAFYLASQLGDPQGGTLRQWMHGLAHNPLTERFSAGPTVAVSLHLLLGVVWAILYGALVEPNVEAPGWQKGTLFAMPLWVLSVLVFLPLAGGGPYGWNLGAGPLPILGNLILHLAYGACLGWVYAIPETAGLEGGPEELFHVVSAERAAIVGIVAGAPLGALAAWLLAGFSAGHPNPLVAQVVNSAGQLAVLGGLFGSAIGALVGSLAGLGGGHHRPRVGQATPHEHEGEVREASGAGSR